MSKERIKYLKKIKRENFTVVFTQIALITGALMIWEALADFNLIDTFITSCPSRVAQTLMNLSNRGDLWVNITVTMAETFAGFALGLVIGFLCAVALWWFPTLSRILDPYLIILNAMPKIALGPIIIIWAGAGYKSIIIMALLISTISTVIGIYSGFRDVDEEKLTLMRTFGASKGQILFKVMIPASYNSFLGVLKINVGLSWVGVIMGEFLVSKAGLGYLIMYGSQVFNLDLVTCGILLVSVCAAVMYYLVSAIEKAITARFE